GERRWPGQIGSPSRSIFLLLSYANSFRDFGRNGRFEMDAMAGTSGGLGVGGRFIEGWTAKKLDSALPIECAIYLSIHFVRYYYALLRTPPRVWPFFCSIF